MHRVISCYSLGALGAILLLTFTATGVAAHETRTVGDGRYEVEVGFLNEPAYLNQPNGLYLDVFGFAAGGAPVEGLAATLQAEVEKDGQTMALTLVPQAAPGVYHATFFPTATGDYSFRLFGTIGDAAIDETFRSSPNTFAAVEPLDTAQFPLKPPAVADLAERVSAVEDDAAGARTLGLIGLVVGVIGVGAAIASMVLTRSGRTARPGAPGAPDV